MEPTDQLRASGQGQAPNAKAYAERFVRSIQEECLDRLIPLGERHFRRAVAEFLPTVIANGIIKGLGNELIEGAPAVARIGRVRRQSRLGGLLNYYPVRRDPPRRVGRDLGQYALREVASVPVGT
jgi:hypothetical protein